MLVQQFLRRACTIKLPHVRPCLRLIHNGNILRNEVPKKREHNEEDSKKKLWMQFNETNITKGEIFKMSPFIQNVYTIRKQESCSAIVQFESEKVAEEHYEKFKEEGKTVNYVGKKSKYGTISTDFKRTLWLKFKNPDISKSFIEELSPDIKQIRMKKNYDSCFVYLVFESEEIAEENYEQLENRGIAVDFCGPKMSKLKKPHEKLERPKFNDDSYRALWLKFKNPDISKSFIEELSPDIKQIRMKKNYDSCFVYLVFESEEIAEENYEQLENRGIAVDFCGSKMSKLKKPHEKLERPDLQFPDEKAPRKLRLMFNQRMYEEEIYALSENIKDVKIRNSLDNKKCKAIVEFETEEQARLYYKWLKLASIREWPMKVHLCYFNENEVEEKSLTIMDVMEDETVDDLMNLFKGAESGHFYTSLYNQRWARLEFPDKQTCVDSMRNYGAGRKIKICVTKKKKAEKELNYKQLICVMRNWETKQSLYSTYPNAHHIRLHTKLDQQKNRLVKRAFLDYENEELARQDFERNYEINESLKYATNEDIDRSVLVLNNISDWADEYSLQELFPDAVKIFIHKTVSNNERITLRHWVHKECSGLKRLSEDSEFKCAHCQGTECSLGGRPQTEIKAGSDKLEVVTSFCCLSDKPSAEDCNLAAITHV